MSRPPDRVAVGAEPIDLAALLESVATPADGAVLLFCGIVREVNDHRPVARLSYDAYAPMAIMTLGEIVDEARQRWGTGEIAVHHRTGTLEIGEVSVAIAVASPHRDAAYGASRYVIEELKHRVPIWKHEHYADGESEWLAGTAPPSAPAADG